MTVPATINSPRPWNTKPVDEVFEVLGGGTPSKKMASYFDGSIPWATIRDMHSDVLSQTDHSITEEGLRASSARVIPSGEVIMASRVGLGKACLLAQDTAINQDIRALIPRKTDKVDRRFCLYWLQSIEEKIIATGSGATVQGIKLPFIKSLPFPDILLEEQKRIVAVLNEAFAALDRARALAEANLADAEELFDRSATRVFASHSDSHPLVKLSEIANLDRGQNPPKTDFIYKPKTGYVRFYQIRDRKTDKHAVYVPDNTKLHKVAPHEILMSAYRHIGEVFRGAEGAFNVALCKISSKSEEHLLNDYLFEIIPTDFVQGELLRHSERSLIPSMSIKHLQTIEIPVPSINRQQAMVTELEGLKVRISKLREACQLRLKDLGDLRQSLLQKAFAGELT
ncbi:restriction endonuclease subunit S [Parasphingorhabdus sp.]|uniref:restriction endonuclease subunit S n=1 Tax=Parasphingorhabdus sp. TaxID=2709688 RepID=UPI0030033F41